MQRELHSNHKCPGDYLLFFQQLQQLACIFRGAIAMSFAILELERGLPQELTRDMNERTHVFRVRLLVPDLVAGSPAIATIRTPGSQRKQLWCRWRNTLKYIKIEQAARHACKGIRQSKTLRRVQPSIDNCSMESPFFAPPDHSGALP